MTGADYDPDSIHRRESIGQSYSEDHRVFYGIVAYAAFLVTILYAIGFVMGMAVPKMIDSGNSKSPGEALVVNLVLLSIFAIQHSVMARKRFKRWWTQFVPEPIERSTYVLISSLCLMLLFWQWRPMPAIVWQVEDPDLALTIATISLAGWILVFTSTFLINHLNCSAYISSPPSSRDASFPRRVSHSTILQIRPSSTLSRVHRRV